MEYAVARHKMVENQIRANKVTDPLVVDAIGEVPREEFLPDSSKGIAYVDEDIAIGDGRYLLEPMVFGRMLQMAEIQSEDVVLDIGCGTGYSSAVLARMASAVVALDSDTGLVKTATANLAGAESDNVAVVKGDMTKGCSSQAPYDVILFNGAVSNIPDNICNQLSDGGRLVAVVRGESGVGHATLVVRNGESFGRRVEFDASVPQLPGFAADEKFSF